MFLIIVIINVFKIRLISAMNCDVLGGRISINPKIITRRLWCYNKHVYMFGLLFKLVK